MSTNVLQVDTKGLCLLCLNPCNSPPDKTTSEDFTSVAGFGKLLRYLEVTTTKLYNRSHQHPDIPKKDIPVNINEGTQLGVSLCFGCSVVTDKFHKLYENYEIIRSQFNDCLKVVHESIKTGIECPTRLKVYTERMKVEPLVAGELLNYRFATNLRDETLKKCSSKLECASNDISSVHNSSSSTYNARVNLSSTPTTSLSNSDTPHPLINRSQKYKKMKCIPPRASHALQLQINTAVSSAAATSNVVASKLTPPASHDHPANHVASPVTVPEYKHTPGGGNLGINILSDIVNLGESSKYSGLLPNNVQSRDFGLRDFLGNDKAECPQCSTILGPLSIRRHFLQIHPESVVRDYFPPDLKSECTFTLCKTFLNLHVPQDFNPNVGVECPYCKYVIKCRRNLDYHIINKHTRVFANEVLAYISHHPPNPGADEVSVNLNVVSQDLVIDLDPVTTTKTDPPGGGSNSGGGAVVGKGRDIGRVGTRNFLGRNGGMGGVVRRVGVGVHVGAGGSSKRLSSVDNHAKADPCQYKRALLQCDICRDNFTSLAQVVKHKNFNGKGKAMNKCCFCENIFDYCITLKNHQKNEHIVPMVMSKIPGRNEEEVGRAVTKIIANIPTIDYRCAWCGEETESNVYLNKHMLVAHFEELVEQIKRGFE